MVTQDMLEYLKHAVGNLKPEDCQTQRSTVYKNMYDHCYRTYKWACRLVENEEVDGNVVKVSALFHDVARPYYHDVDHGEAGAEICGKYLADNGFEKCFIDKVKFCVANHSKSFYEIRQINNAELKALRDCDSLDEVGAVSVLWDTMDQKDRGLQPYTKTYDRLLTHYNEIKGNSVYFHTEAGRELFRERIDFLKCYIENLKYELGVDEA